MKQQQQKKIYSILSLLQMSLTLPGLCLSSEWIPVLHYSKVFLSPRSWLQMNWEKCSLFSSHPRQTKQASILGKVQPVHSTGWSRSLQRVLSLALHGAEGPWQRVLAAGPMDRLSVGHSRTWSTACSLVVIIHAQASLDHHITVEVLVSAVLIWNKNKGWFHIFNSQQILDELYFNHESWQQTDDNRAWLKRCQHSWLHNAAWTSTLDQTLGFRHSGMRQNTIHLLLTIMPHVSSIVQINNIPDNILGDDWPMWGMQGSGLQSSFSVDFSFSSQSSLDSMSSDRQRTSLTRKPPSHVFEHWKDRSKRHPSAIG